ncbi:MAG TPA: hypothetical protein VL563_17135 [Gemmatimonadales bacterium]|jgi:hypothetical protein|nr:hypothetical protein [Gemmatimonadales bacterium]
MLHSFRTAVYATLLACGAAAGVAAQADPDRPVSGGGTLPPGWHARTDGNRPLANVKFDSMSVGHHVTLGPAAIFWRDADNASGSYTVEAKFWQFPSDTHRDHREGYGLLIGGSALQAAGERYTYFLIRDDGMFLVKRRMGDSTWAVTTGWTANEAVLKRAATADTTKPLENALMIRVTPTDVTFLVNGKPVYTAKATDVDASGIVGFRVNHNLSVHLGQLQITKS